MFKSFHIKILCGNHTDFLYERRLAINMMNVRKTVKSWLENDPFTESAAIAYYSIFSLPGLLIILTAIANVAFDQAVVETEVTKYLYQVFGAATVDIKTTIEQSNIKTENVWAMIIGVATLIVGATGLFVHLQKALNQIWKVKVKKSAGILDIIKRRATALGLILSIGFLLLISLFITSVLAAFTQWLSAGSPPYLMVIFNGVNFLSSVIIISFLFGLIFKILPDVKLPWKFALQGGLASALLFLAGEYCLSLYFSVFQPESSFGAAGFVILLMLWVFYSCLILLLGAQITKAVAENRQQIEVEQIARKRKSHEKKA